MPARRLRPKSGGSARRPSRSGRRTMHPMHFCPLCRHDARWVGMAVERDDSCEAARVVETETYHCRACGHLWDVRTAESPTSVLTRATPPDRWGGDITHGLTV